jgi:hypothetical protein
MLTDIAEPAERFEFFCQLLQPLATRGIVVGLSINDSVGDELGAR